MLDILLKILYIIYIYILLVNQQIYELFEIVNVYLYINSIVINNRNDVQKNYKCTMDL